MIVDFEGEPARSLQERRTKSSPLNDLAGALRSLDYAAWTALDRVSAEGVVASEHLAPLALRWRDRQVADCIGAYREIAAPAGAYPENDETAAGLLSLFLLRKALYELRYEIGSRPAWLSIPTRGIIDLVDQIGGAAMRAGTKVKPAKARGPAARDIDAIVGGRHGDCFSVLGPHAQADGSIGISTFAPDADSVEVIDAASGDVVADLEKIHADGFFFGSIERQLPSGYRLRKRRGPHTWEMADPYAFGSTLGDLDIYLLGEGTHLRAFDRLGAHATTIDGVDGVRFAVWAPNASRVSVIGHFNGWDGRRHPMRKHPGVGVWDLFIPGLAPGDIYKYELLDAGGRLLPQKADPVGQSQEVPPATASRVPDPQPLGVGRYGMDAAARRRAVALSARVDLRGASGLVAARRP